MESKDTSCLSPLVSSHIQHGDDDASPPTSLQHDMGTLTPKLPDVRVNEDGNSCLTYYYKQKFSRDFNHYSTSDRDIVRVNQDKM